MKDNLHNFNTIQDVADEIGIKRQTLYNRSKKTGVDISKKSFSDDEWFALVNNKQFESVDSVNDKKLTFCSKELQQRINDQSLFIEILTKEIEAKNIQIDQSQKLQFIAEQRLMENNKELISYKEKEINKRDTFFQRLFSFFQLI